MPKHNPTLALGILAASAVTAFGAAVHADEIPFGANDIKTTFFISKSDDHNRVDYGMRLDSKCLPLTDDNAVFPYWRVFEGSPPVRTQGLSFMDQVPYGIAEQHLIKKSDAGAEYFMRLKQFTRNIIITTKKDANGKCVSLAKAQINGGNAELVSVFAKLAGPISVDYIDVFGKKLEDGSAITERIKK